MHYHIIDILIYYNFVFIMYGYVFSGKNICLVSMHETLYSAKENLD